MLLPQLSAMRTSRLAPCDRATVLEGSVSVVGWTTRLLTPHPEARALSPTVELEPVPEGGTTESTLTVWLEPSANSNVITPLSTPAVRLVKSGTTVICEALLSCTVPTTGTWLSQFTLPKVRSLDLKPTLEFPRLPSETFWLPVALVGVPMNTRPLGRTSGPSGVPAG